MPEDLEGNVASNWQEAFAKVQDSFPDLIVCNLIADKVRDIRGEKSWKRILTFIPSPHPHIILRAIDFWIWKLCGIPAGAPTQATRPLVRERFITLSKSGENFWLTISKPTQSQAKIDNEHIKVLMMDGKLLVTLTLESDWFQSNLTRYLRWKIKIRTQRQRTFW